MEEFDAVVGLEDTLMAELLDGMHSCVHKSRVTRRPQDRVLLGVQSPVRSSQYRREMRNPANDSMSTLERLVRLGSEDEDIGFPRPRIMTIDVCNSARQFCHQRVF